jgi:hypothetical protein
MCLCVFSHHYAAEVHGHRPGARQVRLSRDSTRCYLLAVSRILIESRQVVLQAANSHVVLRFSRALGQGGHLCINGGGREGCMGALNRGVKEGGGKVNAIP